MDSLSGFLVDTNKSPMRQGRGYSTDIADHHGLLHKLARKGHGWLTAAWVDIDYEDVFQEMCTYFLKARAKWNPDFGTTFTAYMGTVVWNSFIKYAKRRIDERVSLNVISVEELRGQDDEHNDNVFERLQAHEIEESIEERLIRHEESRERLSKLSRKSRLVVKELIDPCPELLQAHSASLAHVAVAKEVGENVGYRVPQHLSVGFIGRFHHFSEQELKQTRAEFYSVLGVRVR